MPSTCRYKTNAAFPFAGITIDHKDGLAQVGRDRIYKHKLNPFKFQYAIYLICMARVCFQIGKAASSIPY